MFHTRDFMVRNLVQNAKSKPLFLGFYINGMELLIKGIFAVHQVNRSFAVVSFIPRPVNLYFDHAQRGFFYKI
jgi:hypothetical protein